MSDDRIRHEDGFDEEGNEVTNSLWGGSSDDIVKSIMADTEVNIDIIGSRILRVKTLKGDLGAGTLQELEFTLSNGHTVRITGVGMEISVS